MMSRRSWPWRMHTVTQGQEAPRTLQGLRQVPRPQRQWQEQWIQTIEEVKKRTRCSRCLQGGHWWKECETPPAPGKAMADPRRTSWRRTRSTSAAPRSSPTKRRRYTTTRRSRRSWIKELEKNALQPVNDDAIQPQPEEKLIEDQTQPAKENDQSRGGRKEEESPQLEMEHQESKRAVSNDLENQLTDLRIDTENNLRAEAHEPESGLETNTFSARGTEDDSRAEFLKLGRDSRAEHAQLDRARSQDNGQIAEEDYVGGCESLFLFENWFCEHTRYTGNPPDTACATIDTGCQRLAVGLQTLQDMMPHIPAPLEVRLQQQPYRFKSVHGTSTTKRISILPTSIANNGAYLKPALFEDKHGSRAPLLISLPLLLQCESTLQLIPGRGLYLAMRRSGKKIPCHLGSSGSLKLRRDDRETL